MVSSNLPSGVFFNLFFIDFKALEKNDVISIKECLSFFIQTLINVLQQFGLDRLIKFCVGQHDSAFFKYFIICDRFNVLAVIWVFARL